MGEDADAFLARYDNTVRLSSEGQPRYDLYWTYHQDRREFDFAVDVATKGWVGLGISPNGDMNGGDIVLGWVTESGNTHLTDRFASGKFMPKIDDDQSVWATAGGSFTGKPKPVAKSDGEGTPAPTLKVESEDTPAPTLAPAVEGEPTAAPTVLPTTGDVA